MRKSNNIIYDCPGCGGRGIPKGQKALCSVCKGSGQKPTPTPRIYCTSFCNFGHDLDTGKPVDHECYTLHPDDLQAEAFDDQGFAGPVRKLNGGKTK